MKSTTNLLLRSSITFSGDTNSFQTEVRNGEAEIAEGIFDLADENFVDGQSLVAYARPHLMMIHRKLVAPTCLRAVVKKVSAVGPLVRFDLVTANGEAFVVKISHHRHRELEARKTKKFSVTPGEMKFFPKQSGAEERASDSVDKIGTSARENYYGRELGPWAGTGIVVVIIVTGYCPGKFSSVTPETEPTNVRESKDKRRRSNAPLPEKGNVQPRLMNIEPNIFVARATRGSMPNANIVGTVMSELLPVTTPMTLVRKKITISATSS